MSQKIVILSPHLDDAVLSCWYKIEGPNSIVMTIFAGIPDDGAPSEWDVSIGQTNAKAAMQLRIRENDNALSNTHTGIMNLGYLDFAYRKSSQSVVEIVNKIDSITPRNVLILAPLGIRGIGRRYMHEDHLIIRQVAQALIESGRRVEFYADLPYTMPIINLRNWPRYISKKKIEHELGMNVEIKLFELSPEQQQRKHTACRAYKTQFNAFRAFKKPGAFRWEMIIRPKSSNKNE